MHVCFICQGYANINVFTHVIVNLVFMLVSFIKVNINVIFTPHVILLFMLLMLFHF